MKRNIEEKKSNISISGQDKFSNVETQLYHNEKVPNNADNRYMILVTQSLDSYRRNFSMKTSD